MTESACRNCGATLSGAYCPACGQRRFDPDDRRMGHLLGEFFGAFADFDSRIWRSLRAAMVQPGRIARDWMDGRRACWVSPIRLFLLANLLYFIAPVLTDLNLPLHNQVRGEAYRHFAPEQCSDPVHEWKCRGGQPHSAYTEPFFLRALARDRGIATARGERFDPVDFEQRYHARSDAIGKMLVILHVPFVAAMLALVARGRRRYYAEHFVVALGLVTFVLMFTQMVANPLVWFYSLVQHGWGLPGGGISGFMGSAALAIFCVHFALGCRRCYDSNWITAVIQGILAFFALGVTSVFVYRPAQFLLSLWTM